MVVEYGLVVFVEYIIDVCNCFGVYLNVDCLLVIVVGELVLCINVVKV